MSKQNNDWRIGHGDTPFYTTPTDNIEEDVMITSGVEPYEATTQVNYQALQPSDMEIQCKNYKFTVSVILMGALCLFGMVGNLFCLKVLVRLHAISQDCASPALLLIALSVSDFLLLASFLILKVSPSLCGYRALRWRNFQNKIGRAHV